MAIFELLYGSGLRVAEVHGLNTDDILLDEGWVEVRGKGGKHRQVPLGSRSVSALRAYLPQRIAQSGETALFTGHTGKRLGIRQIQNRLRDWAVKNGSPQHLSPHMMRHSYASHLLQSSGDIRAIQELLGHSNLSATQIYTKLDFDRLAQVYDRAHPRAKRKKTADKPACRLRPHRLFRRPQHSSKTFCKPTVFHYSKARNAVHASFKSKKFRCRRFPRTRITAGFRLCR